MHAAGQHAKKGGRMRDKAGKVLEGWNGPGHRDGVIEALPLEEDGLYSDLDKKGRYEWWYFDAHLDSGHTLVVFFHASNPNPGRTGKTGVEFILISPEGQRTQEFFDYDKSKFKAAKDKPEVRIGGNSITVDQTRSMQPVYTVFVDEGDLGCDLKYTPLVNGWKPGSGLSQFGDLGYMGWVVPFARAAVEGTITHDGQTFQVKGTGYHDHNWLNFQFQRIIEYWMWGRIYSENYTLAYAFIQCTEAVDRHAVKVLMLAEGREVILSTGEFNFFKGELEYNSSARHHYPRQIVIDAPGEGKATLNVKQVLEAQDMLDNFNPALRFIAKNILRIRPGYFRLVSDFVLEVLRGGEQVKETGTTMHEIVIFTPLK
jgi:hypothetical protein